MEDRVNIEDSGLDLVVTNMATGEVQRVSEGPDLPRVVAPDNQAADLLRDLVTWWKNASEDERARLRVHLRQTVPGLSGSPKRPRGRPRKPR